jgi:hypothetical protein
MKPVSEALKHGAFHGIKALLKDLPPIREKKNPLVAALIGFFFGGLGLGIYFKSWKDGVYLVLVALLLLIPFSFLLTPIGLFIGCCIAACWGYARADKSGPDETSAPVLPGSGDKS